MERYKVKSLIDYKSKVTSSSGQPITNLPSSAVAPKPRLLDQVRQAIRTRHYSPRTEETYVHWIKRFILFHNKRHPVDRDRLRFVREMGRRLRQCLTARRLLTS
jgi:hypothetical protein